MPLLRITTEALQDFNAFTDKYLLNDLFEKHIYLGIDHSQFTSYCTYLVKHNDFEPGEYYVKIIATSTVKDDKTIYSFKIEKDNECFTNV